MGGDQWSDHVHTRASIRSVGDRRQEESGHNTEITVAIKRANCQKQESSSSSDKNNSLSGLTPFRDAGSRGGQTQARWELEVRHNNSGGAVLGNNGWSS